MSEIKIKTDDLSDGKVIELLEVHHTEMYLYSPTESIHALDKSEINDPDITFWSAWDGDNLAGCGALKELSDNQGEIKSMRTSKPYLRRGIADRILRKILEEAKARSYKKISLETGTHEVFIPAVTLYKKHGFMECGPFGTYTLDPHSTFLTKEINYD